MLDMMLWIFVGLELIGVTLFVCNYKSNIKILNRRLDNDSMFYLSEFAYDLHRLACDDMNIDPDIDITIYELANDVLGTTISNNITRQSEKIVVSPNQTIEEFIDTVLHETRHVYQSIVTPELIFDTEYVSSTEDMDKYLVQDVEVDARDYAVKAIKKYRRRLMRMVRQYHKQR